MKKILHISKYFYPYKGGIEEVCETIVNVVRDYPDLYRQKIICFNDTNETVVDIYHGVEVKKVRINSVICSQPISSSYFHELKKLLNDFKPDIVHFHLPNPFVSLFLLTLLPQNTKLILHWHSDIIEQQVLYHFIKPIESAILKRANKIIVSSPNYGQNSLPLLKYQDKCVVIPNAIDINKFKETDFVKKECAEIRNEYFNKPIVLFVARHVKYKGLEYLIEAAKLVHSDCHIVVGGSGPLTEELKLKAKGIDNISFIGYIPDDKLAAYYYAATIFAFPSITKNEAFGVALAEAMYCKCLAVTFTIEASGVNWVSINNEMCVEVENKNVKEYAVAIDRLLSNEELFEHMRENAYNRVVSNFVVDKIASLILNLYK